MLFENKYEYCLGVSKSGRESEEPDVFDWCCGDLNGGNAGLIQNETVMRKGL